MICEILKPDSFPFLVCDLKAGETVRARTGAMTAAEGGIILDSSGSESAYDGYDYLMSEDRYLMQTLTAPKPGRIYLTHTVPGELRILELTPEDSLIVNRANFLAASADVVMDLRPEDLTDTAGLSVLQISGPGTLVLGGSGALLDLDIPEGVRYAVDAGQLAAWWAPAAGWRIHERERIWAASEAEANSGETYLAYFVGSARILIQSGRADS